MVEILPISSTSEGEGCICVSFNIAHLLYSGATPETVKKAFEILLTDPKVKSIFINIFGGIMRCDYIAEGVIRATRELSLTIPLVVRLKGTKEAEAKQYVLVLTVNSSSTVDSL